MIVDLSNRQNALTALPTGQSGHAGHVHYIDMVDLWRLVEYYPMHRDLTLIQSDAEGDLRLAP